MRLWMTVAIMFGLFGGAALAAQTQAPGAAYAHEFTSIDGAPMPMAAYEGKAVLVVNTASRCGFTHQYDGLQEIWTRYRDRGLVVIGAPSQDFNQELATAAAVKEFCEVNFNLDFPMTDIVSVKGAGAHPFFAWAGAVGGAPRWNFYKYLISTDGRLLEVFPSTAGPRSRKMVRAIEAALPAAPPAD